MFSPLVWNNERNHFIFHQLRPESLEINCLRLSSQLISFFIEKYRITWNKLENELRTIEIFVEDFKDYMF